jgi:hypothetical protein
MKSGSVISLAIVAVTPYLQASQPPRPDSYYTPLRYVNNGGSLTYSSNGTVTGAYQGQAYFNASVDSSDQGSITYYRQPGGNSITLSGTLVPLDAGGYGLAPDSSKEVNITSQAGGSIDVYYDPGVEG